MAFVASTARKDAGKDGAINDKEDSSPVDCDADEATPLTLSRANEEQMRQDMVVGMQMAVWLIFALNPGILPCNVGSMLQIYVRNS